MSRTLAGLLLALFSYALLGPALVADADAKLAPCCRKSGKHHCAMVTVDAAGEQSSGAALKSGPAKCSLWRCGAATGASDKTCVRANGSAALLLVVRRSLCRTQPYALARQPFSRAWQRRGPPSLPSFS